ncbi:hypothetical protein [Pseudomonas sp. Tri1]|uniref:P-type ATPase n=1 Tax=Pseudomonas sp. Tri1 TaxID=2823875 RepID=UPI001FF08038|nr:hypothetical protein [Pseudomonas sp. Tri1]
MFVAASLALAIIILDSATLGVLVRALGESAPPLGLSAWYENRASGAVEQLRSKIALRAMVRREDRVVEVGADEVVPGDVMLLSAGSLIAADGRILRALDCFISESLLTGETFPVEKLPGDA